jgi:type VI protein secretion system component VasF
LFIGPQAKSQARKRRIQMSGQTTITRTLIAAVGALLMSSVAVGSAIAPAQIAAQSTQTVNA